ncbi:hypothetical protein BD309DRAFT_498620 [Dichomitus squalens]|nr:hypothetical protein BD309DRAFT_498620 [Dichomitus squalens]
MYKNCFAGSAESSAPRTFLSLMDRTLTLDKLAVELLTLVSFFACTDGGQTGCSLALVSKRINYASRPARFYSVQLLDSPTQIEKFLQSYQQQQARATDNIPRVRHLCLSFFGKGLETAPTDATPMPAPRSRAEWLASLQKRAQHMQSGQESLDEQYNRVIPALIRTVAPDLHSLALMQAQWRSSTVLRCQFPCLEEMTLVGGDPTFLPFDFLPSDKPIYPVLKRLHHIQSLVNKDVDFFKWAKHAPELTHLRVSRLDYHPRGTVDTLIQSIGTSAPEDVFPHLEKVVIQPNPGPPLGTRQGTAELSYRDFLSHLRRSITKARVPVLLLPPMELPKVAPGVDPSRGCIMKLRSVWQSAIEGKQYTWETSVAEPQLPPARLMPSGFVTPSHMAKGMVAVGA